MLPAGFCYPADVKTLVCPHCQTAVDQNASLCAGCGAEIVRGASRREKSIAGCLATCIAIVITLGVVGIMFRSVAAPNEKGFAVVVGLLLIAILFNIIGRTLARLLFRSRLRFFRTFQHR